MTHRRAIEEKALKKLYKDDKKSSAEIAKILDKKEDAVRQTQCRALKILKQYFKEYGI